MIGAWISKGSGWIVESIESQYINISTYQPISGSSYINLPVELRSQKKGPINIKNKDQKYFLWCHVTYINPSKEHPERIKKTDKKFLKNLNMMESSFVFKKKILVRLKKKNSICINVFGYENELVFQIKNLKTQWICCF